jgi:acyl-ACP thioesterase
MEYTPYNITTWVSDYGRAMSTRNFVLDCEGEVFGRATTQWSMIDFNTRRAVDLRYLADHNDAVWDEVPPIERAGKLAAVEPENTLVHRVAYSDIDFNRHMNSLRYFDLMLDCLPIELHETNRPVRIEINFLNETRYGQTLTIGYRHEGDRWEFEVATDEGVVACRTTFEWR